jgi:hypothetical protein
MVAMPRGILRLWNGDVIPWRKCLQGLNESIWKIKQKCMFLMERMYTNNFNHLIHKTIYRHINTRMHPLFPIQNTMHENTC